MHPEITHPLLRDITRTLKHEYDSLEERIESGDAGIDYLGASWIGKLLVESNPAIASQTARIFEPLMKKYLLVDSFDLRRMKTSELQALFNIMRTILKSNSFKDHRLRNGLNAVLETLQKKNWLDAVSLANYALHGLRGIVAEPLLRDAESFIRKYLGEISSEMILKYPLIALGVPGVCESLDSEDLQQRSESGPSREIAFLILAISDTIGQDRCKPLTAWVLDYLDTLSSTQYLSMDSMDSVFLSCVGLTILNTKYDKAFLLSRRDYSAVKDYFVSNSIAISRRIEYFQESILLILVTSVVFVASFQAAMRLDPLFALLLGEFYNIISPDLLATLIIFITGSVSLKIAAPFLLPQLSNWYSEIKDRAGGKLRGRN